MAAITVTAANVIPSASAIIEQKIAFETVTAGQLLYHFTATDRYGLADANGIEETNTCYGMAANGASAGQTVAIVKEDPNLIVGGTMTLGKLFIVGGTPGQITESADAATGWHVQYVGMAISTTAMNFKPATVCSSAIA